MLTWLRKRKPPLLKRGLFAAGRSGRPGSYIRLRCIAALGSGGTGSRVTGGKESKRAGSVISVAKVGNSLYYIKALGVALSTIIKLSRIPLMSKYSLP